MSCCPPGSLPAVPTTSTKVPTRMGNTNVFFYDNAASDICVLVIPDIYGPDSGRTKNNCQKLSATYKVALIDAVDGYMLDSDNLGEKLAGWVTARPYSGIVTRINDAVEHLKANHGVKKFAGMGYCWGSWIVAKYANESDSVLSGAVHCHPSWGLEQFFNGPGSGEKVAEGIHSPQLILAAGNDPDWLKPGGVVQKTLAAKPFGNKCKSVAYENMTHGWMCRGDITIPEVADAFNTAWNNDVIPFLSSILQ